MVQIFLADGQTDGVTKVFHKVLADLQKLQDWYNEASLKAHINSCVGGKVDEHQSIRNHAGDGRENRKN